MKKYVVSVVVLMALAGFSGCGNKSREAAMSEALEKAAAPETEQGNFLIYESDPAQGTGAQAVVPATPAETVAAVPAQVQQEAPAAVTDKPTNEQIQQALKNAGLYEGPVDGKIGPKSKKAIRKFQIQNDLTVDGKVGRKTWAKMQPYLSSAATTAPDVVAAEPVVEQAPGENAY